MKRLFSLNRQSAALLIILLLGAILRLWAIDFGLPNLYHPDEPDKVVLAQQMFRTGDLNPRYFDKPSFFLYLNAASYLPYYYVGRLLGFFPTKDDITEPQILIGGVARTNMPSTIVLQRGLTALFGVLSLFLVYCSADELFSSRRTGLLAALMLAVSPTAVSLSRFITADMFSVFFSLLAFLMAVRVFKRGESRYYILGGLAIGLVASSKYNVVIVCVSLTTAHLMRTGFGGLLDKRLWFAGILSIVGFLLTTPYAVLDFPTFWAAIVKQGRHYSQGHPGMEGQVLRFYLMGILWGREGIMLVLTSLAGLVWGFARRKREVLLASAFPIVYFALIAGLKVRNDRTFLPMIPFLAILGASFLDDLLTLAARSRPEYRRIIMPLASSAVFSAIVLVPFPSLKSEIKQLTTVDSRETARIWIEENLPYGSRIAIERYCPFVDPQVFRVEALWKLADRPPEWYVHEDFDYLVFSRGSYGRYFRSQDYPDVKADYERLFSTFKRIRHFTDGGYKIHIHRVGRN